MSRFHLAACAVGAVCAAAVSAGAATAPSAAELQIITPPTIQPASEGDPDFAQALAESGTTLVIGAPHEYLNNQFYVGQAYVYVKPPGGWRQSAAPAAILTASDTQSQVWPQVAAGVAIQRDVIVLGAGYSTTNAGDHEAYVYVKPQGGWTTTTESARLQSPSARYQLGGTGAVAISGDIIVAECLDTTFPGPGSSGCAAIYKKPAHGWSGAISPIAMLSDGGLNDSLGTQISIDGDTIALAAPEATEGGAGYGSGAIEIYEMPTGGWVSTATPTATLLPSDPDAGYLGYSLGMSGDTVVAGMPYALVNGQYLGAAYVFVRNGQHWTSGTQTAKLTATKANTQGGTPAVGIAVAIQSDTIAVGANGATPPDGAFYGGELYVYRKPANGWADTGHVDATLFDPDAQGTLQLGISAAIEGNEFFTGAYGNNSAVPQGLAYVFHAAPKK